MAINNKRFNVSELDFDGIKTSLRDYMQGQAEFSDYDFEGSGLNVLLDVLAYNTHYRALYDNFMLNEMFLDSASKRDNVVSRAKELGYTPTSAEAATAYINFTVSGTTNAPSVMVLPKGSAFSASVGGNSYQFITTESYSAIISNDTYVFQNVKIMQGSFVVDRFPVAAGARYIIENPKVDTSTMTVKVQENSSSGVYNAFTLATSLTNITSSDNVYWLREVRGGQYELEFGNGIIGTALASGNIVHTEYVVTDGGTEANGAKLFKYTGSNLYNGTYSIEVVAQSSGGKDVETIDSIKFNAPRLYATQNRAVTVDDYRNLTYNLVPEAESVNVWSGADNTPPVYGKVFICIKPKTIEKFTSIEKVAIQNDMIGSKNLVTVIPEIVDPQYIKVEVDTTIYYNPKKTTKSANDLILLVKEVVAQYNAENLMKFDGILRFSKLLRQIDDADPAIASNITSLMISRKIEPKYNIAGSYTINIVNPIYAGGLSENAVWSTGFYIPGSELIHYLEDDGVGYMRLYTLIDNEKSIVNARIGTVTYGTGLIQIDNLYITSIVGQELLLTIKPSSYDIVSVQDQLVLIPSEMISVRAIADKSLATSGGGANYEFTTSRS